MEQESKYRLPHNEVPDKTILKYVLRENGALKAENEELKYEIKKLQIQLENKAKAITAFKEWQAKVAEYNYSYWLNQGIELMKEMPSPTLTNALRRFLEKNDLAKKQIKKLLPQLQSVASLRDTLEKELNEQLKEKGDAEKG